MAQAKAPNLDNIQGDIWPGLVKKYQIFWFFQITDASAFRPSLGKLVTDKIITSSADALGHRNVIHEVKTSQPEGTLHELAAVNIAFSHKGMTELDKDKKYHFPDDPFRKGMEHDLVGENRDRIEEWMDEFKGRKVHGVVLVCGTEKKVNDTMTELAKKYFSSTQGIKHIFTLDGRERPGDNAKHEHFGFLDAISQPRLTGFDTKCEKGDGNYQYMCRPGRIIVGHDGDMDNAPEFQHPPWAKDGSYLVIRKFKQYVPEFNSFLRTNAPNLGFSEDQLGARLVGRWKSGAPVQLHPKVDCRKDARMNEFNYPTDSQERCPFASHIRKTKPRSIVGNRDSNDIMRRGIPYGPEVGTDETKTKKDRGLMFTCYQSSISNGFQLLKRTWINMDTFPSKKSKFISGANPGQDPIVGQLVKNPQDESQEELTMSLRDGNNQDTTISFLPFIQANGGDYFFSPSLSFIQELAGGKGKRKEPCPDSIVYQGKFSYSKYSNNENIWAVFPDGQQDGAPIYVLTTFATAESGVEKGPFNGIYPFMKVNPGDRTFTTRVVQNSAVKEYYGFDGRWCEDGETLHLTMYNKKGEKCSEHSLKRKVTPITEDKN